MSSQADRKHYKRIWFMRNLMAQKPNINVRTFALSYFICFCCTTSIQGQFRVTSTMFHSTEYECLSFPTARLKMAV
jgi:hypothetical protein